MRRTGKMDLHAAAVRHVRRELLRHGIEADYAEPPRSGSGYHGDLVARGVTIGVKAAMLRTEKRQVTRAGRVYRYRRQVWTWPLHSHTKREHANVWVLVGYGEPRLRCYVVPDRVLTGKTVRLAQAAPRPTRLMAFRDEWGVLGGCIEIARMRRRAA